MPDHRQRGRLPSSVNSGPTSLSRSASRRLRSNNAKPLGPRWTSDERLTPGSLFELGISGVGVGDCADLHNPRPARGVRQSWSRVVRPSLSSSRPPVARSAVCRPIVWQPVVKAERWRATIDGYRAAAHDRRATSPIWLRRRRFLRRGHRLRHAHEASTGRALSPKSGIALRKCLGCKSGSCHRPARPETHFHVLRGAPEPHDADVDAAVSRG